MFPLSFTNGEYKFSLKILVKFHKDVKACLESLRCHIIKLLEGVLKKGTKYFYSCNIVFSGEDLVFVGLQYVGKSNLV